MSVNSDKAAFTPDLSEPIYSFIRCSFQIPPLISHMGGKVVGGDAEHEVLSMAGARHRAGIISISSRPHDRRIADAAEFLVRQAAG